MALHNLEAEAGLVGSLLLDTSEADEIFGTCEPEDFWDRDMAEIFQTIRRMYADRKPVDMLTVHEFMRQLGTAETVGGLATIGGLANEGASKYLGLQYAGMIREYSRRREIVGLCVGISEVAKSRPADELAQMLSEGIEKATRSVSGRSLTFWAAVEKASVRVRAAQESQGGIIGVPSGLPKLDHATSGLQPGRLYGVAARPGCGKTALLNQIAIHAARSGKPGLICSLEMGEDELAIRAMASESRQNVSRIFSGRNPDADRALEAAAMMGDLPLWIDSETYGLSGILSQAALHRNKHGIEWIAVDHIGLVETEKFNSRNDQIGHITRNLKKLAKRLNIAVIALCQLNRGSEQTGSKPSLHNLRDSGNIEQDLDTAIFLHPGAIDPNSKRVPLEIGLLKNRGGPLGWLDARFEFDGATQTFMQISDQTY